MSPYIQKSAERARLPITVEYLPPCDGEFARGEVYVIDLDVGPVHYASSRNVTETYCAIRAKLEDGQ